MVTCFLDGVPYKERPSVKMLREEFEWMKDISSAALGESRRNFEKTEKQFFNKNRKTEIGKPRFKKKGGVERFLHTRS
jgi:transposase